MFGLLEKSEQIHKEVVDKASAIKVLQETQEKLENENKLELDRLNDLKKQKEEFEAKRDVLSTRNGALREKLEQLGMKIEQEGADTKTLTKTIYSLLGLNFSAETSQDNLIDFKISFKQNRNQFATFVYDPVTEDYDLTSLHPEHQQFRNLRELLRQTKDIQGFLFTYRRMVLNQL